MYRFGYAVGVLVSVGGGSGQMLHLGFVWSRAELQRVLRVWGLRAKRSAVP
jgi:hypothetical protein